MTERADAKSRALRQHGCLHNAPQEVTVPAFCSGKFFDPIDLAQVKYEMLRQVEVEGVSVSRTVKSFGFSRQAFYKALAAFQKEGMPALMSKPRGPKQGHKLTDEILAFIDQQRAKNPKLRPTDLTQIVFKEFGLSLTASTIRRGIMRRRRRDR